MATTARDIKKKHTNSTIFETFDPTNQPQSPSVRASNSFISSDIFGNISSESY